MQELTPRQQQVLDTIITYLDDFGYPPTLRLIGKKLGINGTVSVMKHLEALEKKGDIRRDPGSSRGIVVIREPQEEMVAVPLVGVVRAGLPALAVDGHLHKGLGRKVGLFSYIHEPPNQTLLILLD